MGEPKALEVAQRAPLVRKCTGQAVIQVEAQAGQRNRGALLWWQKSCDAIGANAEASL